MADHDLQPDLQYEDDYGWEQWDEVGDYDDSPVFASTNLDIKPAPVPWYRTGPAVFALAAIGLALLAIVVAGVLLVSQKPSPNDDVRPLRPITDAPTSPAPTGQDASSSAPSPSRSASPSPSPSASPSAESPEPPPPPPPQRDRPSSPSDSDGPRTNVTRPPMSVQPSVPRAHPNY